MTTTKLRQGFFTLATRCRRTVGARNISFALMLRNTDVDILFWMAAVPFGFHVTTGLGANERRITTCLQYLNHYLRYLTPIDMCNLDSNDHLNIRTGKPEP